NMGKLTQMIQEAKARPVFFAASPVNNGSMMGKLDAGNKKLYEYAVALKQFADEQKAPFADQFHALVDVWGKNKPREALGNALNSISTLAKDDKLEGVEHLRKFLEVQSKNPTPVSLLGDPVHPGAPGQLTMAAALLKDLGATPFVSSAVIDAGGKAGETKGCTIEEIKGGDNAVSFDRLDECGPFPIPDEARGVITLYPTILDLSQYTLKVTGLSGERFSVKINATEAGVVSARELSEGINLTALPKGAIAAQGKEILAAVSAKEQLVQQWRAQSKVALAKDNGEEAKKLAELT